MSYVEAEHIRFRYAKKQKPVIDNFSFVMEKGEIVGIIGASGSGKSTLLRIIAGLEEPERGNLSINDRVIMNERVLWRRKSGASAWSFRIMRCSRI